MSAKAEIEFLGNDAGVLRVIQRIEQGLARTERRQDSLERSSRKAAKSGSDGFAKFGEAVKGVGMSLLGGGSIIAGLDLIISKNEEILRQAKEVTTAYDSEVKKWRVQLGLSGPEAGEKQRQVEQIAIDNAVSLDAAFQASRQLGSSGFSKDEASGGSLDALLDFMAATNMSGDQGEATAKALSGFLSSQGLDLNAANVRKYAGGTQALFKNTNIQASALSSLAKEGAAIGSALSTEEMLAADSILLDKGVEEASAAVSLRNVTGRLQTAGGSKDRVAALESVGLTPADVDFEGENFEQVLNNLAAATEKLTDRDQQTFFEKLVGTESRSALGLLLADRGKLSERVAVQSDLTQYDADVKTAQSGVESGFQRQETRGKIRALENFDARVAVAAELEALEIEAGEDPAVAAANRSLYMKNRNYGTGLFLSPELAARQGYGDAAAQTARDRVAEDFGLDPTDGRFRTEEDLSAAVRALVRATQENTAEMKKRPSAPPRAAGLAAGANR